MVHPESSRRSILIKGAGLIGAASLSALAGNATAASASSNSKQLLNKGKHSMGTMVTKDGTEIYYKDWGSGQPVVFWSRLAASISA